MKKTIWILFVILFFELSAPSFAAQKKPKLVLAIVLDQFRYDTHVPLILMGPGIKAGDYYAGAAINDVAPTLSAILGVETPSGSEGRILSEVFTAP